MFKFVLIAAVAFLPALLQATMHRDQIDEDALANRLSLLNEESSTTQSWHKHIEGNQVSYDRNAIQNLFLYLNAEGEFVKNNLKKQVNYIRTNVTGTLSKIREGMDTYFDEVISDIKQNISSKCRSDTIKILEHLKQSSVDDFLHCRKLLPGLVEILDVFDVSVEFIFDIFVTTSQTIKSLVGCISKFWPWEITSCWIDQVEANYHQIINQGKMYGNLIEEYFENITESMAWCVQHAYVPNTVVAIVSPAYECDNKEIPSNFRNLELTQVINERNP